jgi:riboflavin biosynthesis pyrimidine reductase
MTSLQNSKRTSRDFINHLVERNYDYLVCGDEHIDYETAFNSLHLKYGVNIILVDSGPVLNEVLLSRHLIDEISLLVHPILVNKKSDKLLANINKGSGNINLKLLTCENIESKLVLLRYEVLK